MGVSREEVLRVAALARLRLSPEEVERFADQLSRVLDHIAELGEVSAVGEESSALGETREAPLRADEAAADALALPPSALAPEWLDGYFGVPRLASLDADAAAEEPGGSAP